VAIIHSDIAPGREALGRRVLLVARSIAPCLDSLVDGRVDENGIVHDDRSDAIAVLQGVVESVPAYPGIAAQRVGPASVTYRAVTSAFSSEVRLSLRALCGLPSEAEAFGPRGHFPAPGIVTGLWPEVT
jgi:hypothetical protein